jgi:hypothetical protein
LIPGLEPPTRMADPARGVLRMSIEDFRKATTQINL